MFVITIEDVIRLPPFVMNLGQTLFFKRSETRNSFFKWQHTSAGQVLCERFRLLESHFHVRCDFLSERQEIYWLKPFVRDVRFNLFRLAY